MADPIFDFSKIEGYVETCFHFIHGNTVMYVYFNDSFRFSDMTKIRATLPKFITDMGKWQCGSQFLYVTLITPKEKEA